MKTSQVSLIFLLLIFSFNVFSNLSQPPSDRFEYFSEKFADIKILRYQVPGFDQLSSKQKELGYYLYEATMAGRDITWDQKYKYNLTIRRTLESIFKWYSGYRNSDEFKKFEIYLKRVWVSNGIHHHYSNYKFEPDFSKEYFNHLLDNTFFIISNLKKFKEFKQFIIPLIFDPNIASQSVNRSPDVDNIVASANNFYEGVNQKEVEEFYDKLADPNDLEPVQYGLNSKLIKVNGQIVERKWKLHGMYHKSIKKIIYWLRKALRVTENEYQKKSLEHLIKYYITGDLKEFDLHCIEWVKDTDSIFYFVNGFIETYGDAVGYRGSYESILAIKDIEATKRIAAIASNAQWFEDNSSISDQYKKEEVKGISANVVTVVAQAGDAAPTTPIGINLPNSNWIRKVHGSKSVNISNIVHSYNQAAGGVVKEFILDPDEYNDLKTYGALADNLHTDMHEVIGHGSGKLAPGVSPDALKNYSSTIEEARADLVGLYFIMDPKLIEMKLMPNLKVGKVSYLEFITNGLMLQLRRVKLGNNIEEDHMRNRQLIAKWVYENGKKDNVIEKVIKDGKTYFKVNDYDKLRSLFGELLSLVQTIKSEGLYDEAQNLVETFGVKVDLDLHKEVLNRAAEIDDPPFGAFIIPTLKPVKNMFGKIKDVKIIIPTSFEEQMLDYAKNYSFLPNIN